MIGACLSLAAGSITLFMGIGYLIFAVTAISGGSLPDILFRFPIIAAGVLYLIGGYLLFKDQTFGGWFCFIGAAVQLLVIFITLGMGFGPSFFGTIMGGIQTQQLVSGLNPFTGTLFFIDPACAIIGAILGMAAGEKWAEYDQSPSS